MNGAIRKCGGHKDRIVLNAVGITGVVRRHGRVAQVNPKSSDPNNRITFDDTLWLGRANRQRDTADSIIPARDHVSVPRASAADYIWPFGLLRLYQNGVIRLWKDGHSISSYSDVVAADCRHSAIKIDPVGPRRAEHV